MTPRPSTRTSQKAPLGPKARRAQVAAVAVGAVSVLVGILVVYRLVPEIGSTLIAALGIAGFLLVGASGAMARRLWRGRDHLGHETLRLEAIVDAIPGAAVFVADRPGRVVHQNRAARALVGQDQSAEDWLWGDGFCDFDDGKPLQEAQNPVRRIMQGFDGTLRAKRADPESGIERVFEISGFTLSADVPDEVRTLLLLEDRTEMHLLRNELREHAQQESGAQLAWGLAHEMSNVLGIIQISAGTARLDQGLSLSSRRAVDAIEQAAGRGIALTRRLMQLTSGEDGATQLLDVSAVVHPLSGIARRVMPGHVTFETAFPEAEIWVSCARGDLEQAVLGMLSRARYSVAASGASQARISLAVRSEGDEAIIEVSHDAASGSTESGSAAEGVTGPYQTSTSALLNANAALPPVESFARHAGGRLDAGAEGGVTWLRLALPLATQGEYTPATPTAAPLPPGQTDLTGYRLLLVESDTPLMRTLSDGLRMSGATVASAELGQEALEVLRDAPAPDVVITNFVLRDGVRAQEIAATVLASMPQTRLIFLAGTRAGYGMSAGEMPGLVLTKPVQMGELSDAIAMLPPCATEGG